jgi:hypothetical protein
VIQDVPAVENVRRLRPFETTAGTDAFHDNRQSAQKNERQQANKHTFSAERCSLQAAPGPITPATIPPSHTATIPHHTPATTPHHTPSTIPHHTPPPFPITHQPPFPITHRHHSPSHTNKHRRVCALP